MDLTNQSAGLLPDFGVEPYRRDPEKADTDGDGNVSMEETISDWWSQTPLNPGRGSSKDSAAGQKITPDSQDDAISKLANELNLKLDDTTKDYLLQYYLNEKGSQNAWSRTMDASNTQYQRAVKDLQKAGLNPFLALQSLSGSASTSASNGVQGGLYTSSKNAKTQQTTSIVGSALSVLGIIAGAIIGIMAII